jgi:hypothetical protein
MMLKFSKLRMSGGLSNNKLSYVIMNNKKIKTKILSIYPDLIEIEGFYFFRDYSHVLAGFSCEFTPRRVYVSKVFYPLFDRVGFLHLSYSSRILSLVNQPKVLSGGSDISLPEKINSVISLNYSSMKSSCNLDGFNRFLSERVSNTSNPVVKQTYAMCLILLDQFDPAIEWLSVALSSERAEIKANFRDDCLTLLNLVEKNPIECKLLLNSWEEDRRDALSLGAN